MDLALGQGVALAAGPDLALCFVGIYRYPASNAGTFSCVEAGFDRVEQRGGSRCSPLETADHCFIPLIRS
jgi:hypothetical protein